MHRIRRPSLRVLMFASMIAMATSFPGGCASDQTKAGSPQTPGARSPGGTRTNGSGIANLPAGTWRIIQNGRTVTLSEVLANSGKTAAIFQFSGVTCATCQSDAQEYTRRIQSSPQRARIGHIVVFTDFLEDFQDSDFQSFMATWAPQSIRTHDDHAKLWLSLQKNPSSPDRNVLVVLGQNNRGLFLNEAASHDIIFNALETLGTGGQ